MAICLNKNSQAVKNLIAKYGKKQVDAMAGAVSNGFMPLIDVDGKIVPEPTFKGIYEAGGTLVEAWETFIGMFEPKVEEKAVPTTSTNQVSKPNSRNYLKAIGNRQEILISELMSRLKAKSSGVTGIIIDKLDKLNLGQDIPIKFLTTSEIESIYPYRKENIIQHNEAAAFYIPYGYMENTPRHIVINIDKVQDKRFRNVAIHEILHAYSNEYLYSVGSESFTNFFEHTKIDLIDRGVFSKDEYMLKNEDEFLVALFTEKKLMDALKDLPTTKPNFRTRWAEFVNFIKNFLNIGTQNLTRLDEAISEGVEIISRQSDMFDSLDQSTQNYRDISDIDMSAYSIPYSSENPVNRWSPRKLENRIINVINSYSTQVYGHNALIYENGRYKVYAGKNNSKKQESLNAIRHLENLAQDAYGVAGFTVSPNAYTQYVIMNPLELSAILDWQKAKRKPSFMPADDAKDEKELRTENALLQVIGRLKKRSNILSAKKKNLSSAELKQISDLQELYGSAKYFQGLLEFTNNAKENLGEQYEYLMEMEQNFDQEIADIPPAQSAKTLRDAHTYFSAITPILTSIKEELKTKEFKAEVLKEFGIESATNEADMLIKRLNDDINTLKLQLEDIETLYYKLSVPIFSRYLSKFAEGSGLDIDKITDMLKVSNKDISFWDRWLYSMADSSDDVLRMINEAVGQAKERARLETIDNKRDLIKWQEELKEAGYKDYDWMYDKTDGKFNGYLIDKYKWDEFHKAESDFLKALNKEYGLENKEEASEKLTSQQLKKYKSEIYRWYNLNTQYNKANERRLLEEKKQELGDAFDAWLEENTYIDKHNGITTITERVPDSKKSFVLPAEKYRNKAYDAMSVSQKKFYDRITGLKEELDKNLPVSRRNRLVPPQIRKDFVEKAKSIKSMDEAKAVAKDLWESYDVVDDYDRGMQKEFVLTDTEGRKVDLLPIKFSGKMANPNSNLSRDIIGGLTIYSSMANDYGELNKIIDVLELGKDVLSQREMQTITAKGNIATEAMKVLGKRIENNIATSGSASNSMRRLEDYYQMVVYGKYKATTDKTIFGKDREKMVDLLGRYTSINGLALNMFAGFANIGFGNIMIRTEAMAGQFISNKSLMQGSAKYWKHLPNTIGNIGKVDQKDKLTLWIEYFNTLQDFESSLHEVDSLRKNRLSKMFKSSTLFFINNIGEHFMQTRMSLGMAMETKLKDATGSEISLFDAFIVKDGKLVLQDGVSKLDGSKWTEKDTIKFIRKQNFVNKRLHGIYNYVDRNALQQYAIGRLAMMFRKFIVPGLIRRYQPKQYSFEGQTVTEGFYRTAMSFFGQCLKEMKQGQYNIMKTYNKREDWQRANVNRFMTELLHLIGVAILAAFVFDDEEEQDTWALQMAAYQANRLFTELGFYNPLTAPSEALKILKTPIASVNAIQDTYNFIVQLMPWNFTDEISRGKFEGWYRWQRNGFNMIPGVHQLHDLMTPEEKLRYFTFTK